MKKRKLIIAGTGLVVLGSIASWYAISRQAPPLTAPKQVASTVQAPAAPAEDTIQKPKGYDLPAKIKIDKLNISGDIRPVDITSEGNMDVPGDLQGIGWYKRNPAPGNIGNAVIAGHKGLNREKGVFWRLRELTRGDTIVVIDKQNKEAKFTVKSIERYTPASAPLERIFGVITDKRQLNLITCDGNWIPATKDYTHRVVVYAEFTP